MNEKELRAKLNNKKGENKMIETDYDKIQIRALRIAERNLTSGLWTIETAQLYLRGVSEYPETVSN